MTDQEKDLFKRLLEAAKKAFQNIHEYSEGCLFCGEEEDSHGNPVIVEGESTNFHKQECWYYLAKRLITQAEEILT